MCWFHWFFCNFWWFHDFFASKLETLGGIHEMRKIILENIWYLDWVRGLERRQEWSAPALRSGLRFSPRTQSRHQMGFNIFWFFAFHEYHPRFSSFLAKKSWIPSKITKNQWNSGQKIKKIRAVYVEILLWWYFGQKYSHSPPIMPVYYRVFNAQLQIVFWWIL